MFFVIGGYGSLSLIVACVIMIDGSAIVKLAFIRA